MNPIAARRQPHSSPAIKQSTIFERGAENIRARRWSYMNINSKPTTKMPQAHRFVQIQSAGMATVFRPGEQATASGLTRAELRKIVVDLIG